MRFSVLVAAILLSGAALLHADTAPVEAAVYRQLAEQPTVPVWVFFTDKGDNGFAKLADVEAALLPRARERRLRNRGAGNLVDRHDMPVPARYRNAVKERATRLRHTLRWFNAVTAEVNADQLESIRALPFVERIERVATFTMPAPELTEVAVDALDRFDRGAGTTSLNYGGSFSQNQIMNTIPLHDLGFDGSGVLIASFDSGFNNFGHQALQHLSVLHTWDFINGDSIVTDQGMPDDHNHGTYTLSSLAGYFEGQLVGPAYGADFLLAKTENVSYERHIEEDNWAAAAEWADSLGADIITSSLGYRDFDFGEGDYTTATLDGNTAIITIAADLAASRGILVVTSAGNGGSAPFPGESTIGAPADGDSVLAVGAVNPDRSRSSFSSVGPTGDGRIKPDVMAQGTQVVCISSQRIDGYVGLSGTSFSCPLTAGAAALLLQADPTLTNMEIIEALKNTADNALSPDNEYGWGIIDAHAAWTYTTTGLGDGENLPERLTLFPAYPNPFNPSTTIRFYLAESGPMTLRVYNPLGQVVDVIENGFRNAGEHRVEWNAEGLNSGVYFISLSRGRDVAMRKVVFLK